MSCQEQFSAIDLVEQPGDLGDSSAEEQLLVKWMEPQVSKSLPSCNNQDMVHVQGCV